MKYNKDPYMGVHIDPVPPPTVAFFHLLPCITPCCFLLLQVQQVIPCSWHTSLTFPFSSLIALICKEGFLIFTSPQLFLLSGFLTHLGQVFPSLSCLVSSSH